MIQVHLLCPPLVKRLRSVEHYEFPLLVELIMIKSVEQFKKKKLVRVVSPYLCLMNMCWEGWLIPSFNYDKHKVLHWQGEFLEEPGFWEKPADLVQWNLLLVRVRLCRKEK